ncbi:antibiotic biosynthesis monooxygenase family protein [Pseudomonas sp. PDM04]|uniref:antibiotic biosynthesis monooxygenase family protein n=1 Tax=Pseudomonas sp. PDM04 TaxID=2769296 RepID=UPI00177FC35B|nr:antibiotic biosynthesis monooxygenase [Pseudomonas sp. PDM04]MBD9440061.1 antibiotic biosynthesis monooxygenase [Pseudomonas sp. PDM04]
MALIHIEEGDTFTQIVRFDVPADKQLELIDAIAGEVERWIRHRPGFISSTFHASFDGRHVVNYAQWKSRADFEGFTHDPETKHLQKAIRAVALSLEPNAIHCRVIRSITPVS